MQILRKFPEHGDTLAFKALLVSQFPERQAEAHDIAKAGLKADIKSFMCWHVFGLLHKQDRNYEQAAKCYMNAMRIDPENVAIARDLCHIQMQLRDIPSLIQTAEKVLGAKANVRNSWLMLAVAHHLAGHHDLAVGVRPCVLRWGSFPCSHTADLVFLA
jgi:N-alpha-acetyltransferase 15/16, NatA auxiliary subunit